jgi:hypothetical protein
MMGAQDGRVGHTRLRRQGGVERPVEIKLNIAHQSVGDHLHRVGSSAMSMVPSIFKRVQGHLVQS